MPRIRHGRKDLVVRSNLLNDFSKLIRLNLRNSDYDCIYPLTMEMADILGWDKSELFWFCIYYMTFYNESSALLYHWFGDDPSQYPLDTARRNLRPPGFVQLHLDSWEELGGLEWLTEDFTKLDREENWRQMYEKVGQVWGNGRWAQYTTCDMLHKCLLVSRVKPPDTGWRGASGPLRGLKRLAIDQDLDAVEAEVWKYVLVSHAAFGARPDPHYWGNGWDHGVLESLLCDLDGLCKGGYYSGRNIDRMHDRMKAVTDRVGWYNELSVIFEARERAFPTDQLGEYNGWFGIDKPRKKVYVNEGKVLCSTENRSRSDFATNSSWKHLVRSHFSG